MHVVFLYVVFVELHKFDFVSLWKIFFRFLVDHLVDTFVKTRISYPVNQIRSTIEIVP